MYLVFEPDGFALGVAVGVLGLVLLLSLLVAVTYKENTLFYLTGYLALMLALVLAGGVYVPPAALRGAPAPTAPAPAVASLPIPPDAASLGLTGRQLEVLGLLMQGKNNKLICRALDLAEPTVKNHVSAILKALGVSSRTEAVLAVTRLGLTLPPVG